ncbi:MAG: glutamate--cysteine ligase [Candidatus Thiodiazotropha sp. (ex Myrtea spinifera)]|nr:glutamate--cysteine ligase [Candidatus Thiodiazotropha sp. (ex Myrtea spinifera)]
MTTMASITHQIPVDCITGSKIGLEKEGLRVSRNGVLSDTSHPYALGSALTHPSITTDFSEALLELITPPTLCAENALHYLTETETFVHQNLADEMVWSASMPCIVENADQIPIANYGHSDSGMSKQVYRRGLAHRYGKMMQVIAGIHFNHSFSDDLWPVLQKLSGDNGEIQSFIADGYMHTLRNVQRYDWLLLYLFGASPATDRSFAGAGERLERFDKETYYAPYATSLRMGDMGYTNRLQTGRQMNIDCNSLDGYLSTMQGILKKSHPAYEEIGVIIDGIHQQLNTHLLQIENEFYTSVRPKQIPLSGESPLEALQQRGIRYLELRSIDVNPFTPTGVEIAQLHFLEVFTHFSLISESPYIDHSSTDINRHNLNQTAYFGRSSGLKLNNNGKEVSLREWGNQIFDQMQPVAELLDKAHNTNQYLNALKHYQRYLSEPELTPSAKLLSGMREQRESFSGFIQQQSASHHDHYLSRSLSQARFEYYEALTRQSFRQQRHLECQSEGLYGDHESKITNDRPYFGCEPCVCASSQFL